MAVEVKDESPPELADGAEDAPKPDEKPARRRYQRVRPSDARSEPVADERGHVLRENEDGSPRFSPYVTQLSAKAQRTVRTGSYESFEISTILTFEPDRRFSTAENMANVNDAVTSEVNRVAAFIESTLEVQP